MRHRVDVVPATAALVAAVHGGPLPRSARAVCTVADGVPLSVSGVFLDEARQVMFLDVTEPGREILKADLRACVRAIRATVALAWPGLVIHAGCDDRFDGAERMLRHVGFEPLALGVWAMRP